MSYSLRKISGRILIVDSDPSHANEIERILAMAGCTDHPVVTNQNIAIEYCERVQPDAVLLDLRMTGIRGQSLLERFAERFPRRALMPIIVLSTDARTETKYQSFLTGATDFLPRPVDALELVMRLYNHLEIRRMHFEALKSNADLEARVAERTADLEVAITEFANRISIAAEFRDDETGDHVENVAELSARICKVMGGSAEEVELMRRAARLHDVGKIAVPDAVLLKRGSLSAEEQAIMRRHTTAGSDMLGGSKFPLLIFAEEIALRHHERWDGSGYPDGLKGDQIPLSARIAAVADAFDSLTRDRPYRDAWRKDTAIAEIHRLSGTQFDPEVVEAFDSVMNITSVRESSLRRE